MRLTRAQREVQHITAYRTIERCVNSPDVRAPDTFANDVAHRLITEPTPVRSAER